MKIFRRHPDLVDISADECHALWFAFLSVRDEFVTSFPTGVEREAAERFGLGFRYPGTKESFVPTPRWQTFYLKLSEEGLTALFNGANVRLICRHFPDEHRQFLENIITKLKKK